MSPEIKGILAELRQRFETIYGDRLVRMVLFGSQARGDAEADSDIDVLVVLKGIVSLDDEFERTENDVAEISLEHNVVVTCIFVSKDCFESERSPLLLNVRREGVLV